jgi:hypothetical protein
MSTIWLLGFLLSLLLQAGLIPPFPEGILSPAEKTQIERESNIQRRIKIYETASARIQQALQSAISKKEFQTVPENLTLWTSLLTESLKDIEDNLKSKKKSRALIKYEIQVRKSIAAIQAGKIKAPADQQDAFDLCLARAGEVRSKFVEILFRH